MEDKYLDLEDSYHYKKWFKSKVGQCISLRDKNFQKIKSSWDFKSDRLYLKFNRKKIFNAEVPLYDEEELIKYKKKKFTKSQKKLYPKSELKKPNYPKYSKQELRIRKRPRFRKKDEKKYKNVYDYNKFKDEFSERNYPIIEKAFGEDNFTVIDIKMNPLIINKFMNILYNSRSSYVLGYHGTNKKNFKSIENSGLLIPGKKNNIKVANGSAHGLGIYTAREYSNWLSFNFNDNSTLMACAIIDNFDVKQVYDARVIFNERIILPIWYVKYYDVNTIYKLNNNKNIINIQKIRIVDYLNHKPNVKPLWVGKRRKYIEETDEIVWLPADGEWYCEGLIKQKRDYFSKLRNLERYSLFMEKYF